MIFKHSAVERASASWARHCGCWLPLRSLLRYAQDKQYDLQQFYLQTEHFFLQKAPRWKPLQRRLMLQTWFVDV